MILGKMVSFLFAYGVYPQERNFNIVLDVLTRFRAAEVEKAVNALDSDQTDILMKYIYRGFANPTENSCGILLVWHEKVSHSRKCMVCMSHRLQCIFQSINFPIHATRNVLTQLKSTVVKTLFAFSRF